MFLKGENNRLDRGLNKIGGSMRRDVNRGYHGCVGQTGTTKTPTA